MEFRKWNPINIPAVPEDKEGIKKFRQSDENCWKDNLVNTKLIVVEQQQHFWGWVLVWDTGSKETAASSHDL